jgi:hypothetical protein
MLYQAKSPMKNYNCLLQRRNARHTFVDQPETTETSGHPKSRTFKKNRNPAGSGLLKQT